MARKAIAQSLHIGKASEAGGGCHAPTLGGPPSLTGSALPDLTAPMERVPVTPGLIPAATSPLPDLTAPVERVSVTPGLIPPPPPLPDLTAPVERVPVTPGLIPPPPPLTVPPHSADRVALQVPHARSGGLYYALGGGRMDSLSILANKERTKRFLERRIQEAPPSGYDSKDKESLAEESNSSGLGSERAAEPAGRRAVSVRPYEDQDDNEHEWTSFSR
ncbi:WAS/WASL-interacting protein family member 3-like [Pollicipes pollicipes]|uniref:WAS/WASL-interacting protein family member 3-like n=1 Tax=Pollicipes pollicipes TaxID=41117 RepID=UPI00188555DA|nr:WAS/WASL-interacting protein family member 3-like [Pollicipes pollicipes]